MVADAPQGAFCATSVTPFLRSLVAGKRRLFYHFPDLHDEDDLFQIAVMSAELAHGTYQVAKACNAKSGRYHHPLRQDGLDRRYVSWLGKCVTCDLIDLYRKRVRQATREAKAAVARNAATRVVEWHDAGEEAGLPGGMGDGGDELLDEWLGRLYRYAVRAFEPYPWHAGSRRFTAPQCVCATLLMRRERLSSRRAAALFAGSPELVTALQLKQLPSDRWFARARWVARHLGIPDLPADDGGE